MTANKQHIVDQIIKGIEDGKDRGKLLSIFVKKLQVSDRTFDRYWKIANIQYGERQQAIKNEIAAVDTQTAIETRKDGLKSKIERLLFYQNEIDHMEKQLKGEVRFVFILGYKVKPSHIGNKFKLPLQVQNELRNNIKSYQSEISKIEGDYAPTKSAQTNVNGEDVKPAPVLTDDKFHLLITKINAMNGTN